MACSIDFVLILVSNQGMRDGRCIRIYKYRSLSGKYGRDTIEYAIKRNALYWQSPATFNDPFDCFPVLYFGDDAKQIKKFHVRAAAQVCDHQPRNIRRQQRRQMNEVPVAQMEMVLRSQWDEWLSASAMACFSEVHDDPLMWAHYADSHRGVCFIFDEIADDTTQWFAFPVGYQEARPRVNLTCFNDPDVMLQALCLKSAHWSYESEQRMIEWRGLPDYREFPRQQLRGIIFGARIERDDEAFVRALLQGRPELRVFKAAIDATKFKLNIVPS